MAVRATVSRFPIDPGAQDGSGLPWGVTVTPFAEKDEVGQSPEYGSEGDLLPRCENCWGYFNTYCELEQWSWNCSLCGTLNGLSSKAIARYSRPDSCPEMMSSFVDLELPGESLTHSLTPSLAHWLTVWLAINNLVFVSVFFFCFWFAEEENEEETTQARPVYVAAVDLSCMITTLFDFNCFRVFDLMCEYWVKCLV